jgi:hypothetical protein
VSQTTDGELTPDRIYNEVWKDLVESEGSVNMDAVKGLLADYSLLLKSNMVLYPYLTDGRVTHPQHDVEELIEIADHTVGVLIDDALRQLLDIFLNDLQATEDKPAEERLQSLTDLLNDFYERGVTAE